MAVQLQFTPNYAFGSGIFEPGAKATFFLSGTTTPVTVYSDEALTSAHPVPLVADASGQFATVWAANGVNVKAVVVDSEDAAMFTIDKVVLGNTSIGQADTVSLDPVSGLAATDVQAAIEEIKGDIGDPTAAGRAIMEAADAAAQRTAMGLGNLATQDAADLAQAKDVFLAKIDAASNEILIDLSSYSYNSFRLDFVDMEPAAILTMRTSSDGGSTYALGASDYAWVNTAASQAAGGSTSTLVTGDDADREIVMGPFETCEGYIEVRRAKDGSARTLVFWEIAEFNSSGFTRRFSGSGQRRAATADNDLRIYADAGTLTGSVVLSGLRES